MTVTHTMADIDPNLLYSSIIAVGGSVVALGRWMGGVWRDLRREQIASDKEKAKAAIDSNDRMIDALNTNARELATLTAMVHTLCQSFDAAFERTPVPRSVDDVPSRRELSPSERRRREDYYGPVEADERSGVRRAATSPLGLPAIQGYRPPRHGGKED